MTDYEDHLREDDDDTGLAAFDVYAPTEDTDESNVPDRDGQGDADASPDLLFTACNAADSVRISALIDGSIRRIELSRLVSDMTETELAREILNVAGVAAAKGRAGQYELVSKLLQLQGQDEMSSRELLVSGLGLPTPEQAIAAEAALTSRHMRH
jgi:hypothetical protein